MRSRNPQTRTMRVDYPDNLKQGHKATNRAYMDVSAYSADRMLPFPESATRGLMIKKRRKENKRMQETANTGIAVVTGAISNVVDVVGQIFTVMTGNAYLVFFMAAGLLGVGIGIFKRLKGAAK